MQTTQDRALRRISELKEQSNLEKQAKMHLEEELRAELEEKQHVIDALSSKVSLLKDSVENRTDGLVNGTSNLGDTGATSGKDTTDDEESTSKIEVKTVESESGNSLSAYSEDSEKIVQLEEKVRRLESLLSKC